jgi:hypothetical protein
VALRPAAIMPFSGPDWIEMANGFVLDQRGGQTIRNVNGRNITRNTGGVWVPNTPTAGDPDAPVQEANVPLVDSTPAYPGVRFLFNVTDSTVPSYPSVLRYIGFDNVEGGSTSPLCSGAKASFLLRHGFGPLPNTPDPAHNLAGSTCRLY